MEYDGEVSSNDTDFWCFEGNRWFDPLAGKSRRTRGSSVQPIPLIACRDVEASSLWYQAVLGGRSGHGGREYEQIHHDRRPILQLHHWDAHEHPHLGDSRIEPHGNGVLLWFQTDDFDGALDRISSSRATVIEGPKVNPNAQHREIWLRDPDGYVVVIAGRRADLG